ncbi:hypothetical protein IWW43_005080 [Coemansia sp. RSA 1935]|nr:hypothetical protein J3F82_003203 [Coemansia sp. RSA 637]KAJ2191826.1 hypothetical protein GGH18_003110 [Coemansia sp. RSA 530]KAJ2223268.1 hypothetical protein IW143_001078 [Coemansia sp. RSA 520]KAJ2250094.1 hypothetical protein GGH97_000938 [Coemansia sp. RSA 475]KAJ2276571.1 hypothetical protein J3F81_001317 [Coemansia sp. RSA 371]KAJ2281114.1 hypothetical protein GGH14_002100 [Coemansia sp. RSA 370]KAJ2444841.1 hypothetical protein IWW46_001801 [Coemansia sp. RSA 2440]KAJ2529104.1 hy
MWKQNLRQFGGQPENISTSSYNSHELRQTAKYSHLSRCRAQNPTTREPPYIQRNPKPARLPRDNHKPSECPSPTRVKVDCGGPREQTWTLTWPHEPHQPVPYTRGLFEVFSEWADSCSTFDELDKVEYGVQGAGERVQGTRGNGLGIRSWSKREEEELVEHVRSNYASGKVAWPRVATAFGRTEVGCMAKYHALVDHM